MSRLTPVTPLKQKTSKSMRALAAQVHQTFPEMVAHQHLQDAAAALDGGRTDGAQRHINAAIASFQPQTLHRHGIQDDEGHQAGKTFMHAAHRHLLLVKDIADMGQQNAAVLAAAREAKAGNAMTNAQPIPIGRSDGAAQGPASPPVGRQVIATSWEGVCNAIELAGPKGYSHGWVRASQSLRSAQVAQEGGDSVAAGMHLSRASAAVSGKDDKVSRGIAAEIHRAKVAREGGDPVQAGMHLMRARRMSAQAARTTVQMANPVELVGPKGYTHGWIKVAGLAAMDVLGRSNPAWNPDMPGFGQPSAGGASSGSGRKIAKAAMGAVATHNPAWNPDMPGFGVSPQVHMAAAQVHSKAASAAPPGSRRQAVHQRMAKIHTAAARTLLSTNGAWNPDMPGFGVQGSPTVQTARQGPAVELVGPKGYVHGWKYVGGPGLPAKPGGPGNGFTSKETGRIYMGGKVVGTSGTKSGAAIIRAAASQQQGLHGAGFGHDPKVRVTRAIAREKARRYGPAVAGRVSPYEFYKTSTTPPRKPPSTANINPKLPGSTALRSRMDAANSGWRQVIGNYDRAIASGTIQFPARGKGKFTSGYPGMAGADKEYMAWLNTKLPGMAMSWEGVDRAIELSAETGALASTPHPLGTKGLWGVEGMQLPPYIQNIARALMRKRGMDESRAIAIAKAATDKWGRGGGKVTPEVRAASLKTGAEWESKRATSHAQANSGPAVELVATAAGGGGQAPPPQQSGSGFNSAAHPRAAAGSPAGGQFAVGGGSGQSQQKTAHQKHVAHMQHMQHMAGSKAGLLQQAGQWRAQAAALGKQITSLNKAINSALASAAGKKTTGQKGAKTAATAKTGTTAPATTKTAATTATATGTKTATTTAKAPAKAGAKAAAPAKAGSISGMRSQVKALTAQRNQLLQQAAQATAKAAKM